MGCKSKCSHKTETDRVDTRRGEWEVMEADWDMEVLALTLAWGGHSCSLQKLKEGSNGFSPGPFWHLHFRSVQLISRTVREYIPIVLNHQVWDHLLQQPLDTNTALYWGSKPFREAWTSDRTRPASWVQEREPEAARTFLTFIFGS